MSDGPIRVTSRYRNPTSLTFTGGGIAWNTGVFHFLGTKTSAQCFLSYIAD